MTESTATFEALDPARSISLEASAGSGKTWQLVSRVLRLLLEGAEPGGILALTFTRKAAIEMRLRLNERLRKLATESDDALAASLEHIGLAPTPELKARARRLYRELLFAAFPPRAMTLHAFCQELLGRFALEAGVPPGFGLYDNEAELMERSWRRLQGRLTSEPEGTAANALGTLVDLGFTEFTLRELIDTFLQRRGDWWAYTDGAGDTAAWATERLHEQLGRCDADAALRAVDSDALTAHLKMLYRWLRDWGNVNSVKAENLEPALDARGEERLALLEEALLTKGEPRKFEPGRKFTAAQRDSLLDRHTQVVQDFLAARDQWTRAQVLARSAAAFTLGAAALEALDEELARSHALGFTELEWHTCRLLKREGAAEWVRYRLDRRVDHLLIDEFQDTSPTQWRMLLPLLQEMAAGDSDHARSLFIVGDAKQSIYGFRRADPRLLPRATHWMQQHLAATSLPLHHSRRSAPAIIEFVNALFTLDPLEGAIGFTTHDTHRKHDWGRVEVAPLVERAERVTGEGNGAFRDPLAAPRLTAEDQRAREEAQQVSQRIRALVTSGVEVTTQHGPHRLGWGDVMVLARSRTHLHALERQFTEDGIPFVGAARGTLLKTSIARDLTALLRLLEAPHRNLELAQVLRSPLFGASDELLVQIATISSPPLKRGSSGEELDSRLRGNDGTTWLDALARIDDPLLARAHALISAWREVAARLPAHDLLDRIARDTDAATRYERALPVVTGARARANLGAFLQLALEADSGRYPSLPRFLEWLEAQERAAEDAPDEPPPAAATELVRIMTIHAAKGLEAPAVFLINAGGGQPPRTPRWLIEWPEHSERPTHFLVAPPAERLDMLSRRLADAHKARETREELNILYVAATRARQFLHISGFESRANDSWHEHALAAMEKLERAALLPGCAPGTLCYADGTPPVSSTAAPAIGAIAVDPRLRRPIADAATQQAAAPSQRAEDGSAWETAEAAARGTAIHLLLQRLSEGAAAEEDLWKELCARLDLVPAREDFTRWLATARALLAEPALAPYFERSRYARAWNEVAVFTDGVTAVIDRLVDDGKALWVLDYKTHARPDAKALGERYRAQLAAYVDAVKKVWPDRSVRGGLILTATREFVSVI